MKKFGTSLLAAVLCLVLCFGIVAQPLSIVAQAATQTTQDSGASTSGLRGDVATVATAVGKYAFGRIYSELSSWAISNDVPVAGSLAKLMLDPSQRAALKQSEQVSEIHSTVAYISESVTQISQQLKDIKAQLNALDKKTDEYHATELLATATQNLNSITTGYNSAWSAYEDLDEAVSKLGNANDALAQATDADKIPELEEAVRLADLEVQEKTAVFIALLSQGGEKDFTGTIDKLKIAIYDPASPTSSYLGALETYLRTMLPFEHQITGEMTTAMNNCGSTLYHIFLMYSEYYTYMRAYTERKNENDPDAGNPYKIYTDAFFESLAEKLTAYFDGIALDTGIANYMVEEPLNSEQIKEYREIDPDFVVPECIDTNVTINGVSYQCYKVRSNSDLQYYIILKSLIDKDQLVQTISDNYFSWKDVTIWRPTFLLEHEFTDDGRYRLISQNELPDFVEDAHTSVLSYLRVDGGLVSIPQNAAHILLRDSTCKCLSDNNIDWDIKAVNLSASGNSDVVTIKSDNIKNGGAGSKSITIYRMVDFSGKYKNGTFQVIDQSEIAGKVVTVDDGQTLDLTQITVDVTGVTINVVGKGTIISNSGITLRNSRINVFNGAVVTIENLNITAQKGSLAAIVLSDKGSTITFKGTNNVSGTATGSNNAVDYYANYVPEKPIGASHGLYAVDNTSLVFTGTSTFSGADGGAGICATANLILTGLDNGKVVANGSKSSIRKADFFRFSIGAGIGGSFSTGIEYAESVIGVTNTTAITRYYRVPSGKSSDYIGSGANVEIKSLNVEVSGVDVSNINRKVKVPKVDSDLKKNIQNISFSSDDIGGVNAMGTGYDMKSGIISKSTVSLKRQKISAKIVTRENNNAFKPEIYTITAYTHGSDGVTKEGVSFRLHGKGGTSEWIKAGGCGVKKDTWTGSFTLNTVGELESIEVRVNKSGDTWFPGEITVTSSFGGETLTVYGGRAIDKATTLSPKDNIFKVTIETGTENNSGTNADIFFRLKDKNGNESDSYQLDAIHYENDAFEKGDKAVFWLYAPSEFEVCNGFYLSSDCSGVAAQWKVDSVTVQQVQGKHTGDSFTISSGYWFRISQNVFFGRNTKNTGVFYIEVKTSDKKKAGTDSNIYLTINGSNGSTGEIELDAMAKDGNNFERGDLDTMCIGFDTESIGEIKSIAIRKDNAGIGPDWHLEYISVKEIVATGQTAQSYKFTWNQWIKNKTYTLTEYKKLSSRQNMVKFDREILSGLAQNDDGSYTLMVDREITLSDSVFELLAEKSAVLNVVMEDDGKALYEVIFDGGAFESWRAVTLGKNYGFADGKALFSFLQNADLPAKTKIRIHAKNLNFLSGTNYQLYAKDEGENWSPLVNTVSSDGVIEFYAQAVQELMILDRRNTWLVQPDMKNYVSGETPSVPAGEALYGDFTVRYTGTAADGTSWDSSKAPTKAGNYTAIFTVEAGSGYDGLTYELDFKVTAPASVPDPDNAVQPTEPTDPVEPDEPTEPADPTEATEPSDATEPAPSTNPTAPTESGEPVEPTVSVRPQEKGADFTWVYAVLVAVVMLGAGFGIGYLVVKKKKD